jgi:hypothetical protein
MMLFHKVYKQVKEKVKRDNPNIPDYKLEKIIANEFGAICFEKAQSKYRVKITDYKSHRIWDLFGDKILIICNDFNTTIDAVISASRERDLVMIRQCIIAWIKANYSMSLNKIGEFFGGRDHSTVIHAIQTKNDLYGTDRHFTKTYDTIANILGSGTEENTTKLIYWEVEGLGHA